MEHGIECVFSGPAPAAAPGISGMSLGRMHALSHRTSAAPMVVDDHTPFLRHGSYLIDAGRGAHMPPAEFLRTGLGLEVSIGPALVRRYEDKYSAFVAVYSAADEHEHDRMLRFAPALALAATYGHRTALELDAAGNAWQYHHLPQLLPRRGRIGIEQALQDRGRRALARAHVHRRVPFEISSFRALRI